MRVTLREILEAASDYFGRGGINADCEGPALQEALKQINRATRILLKEGRNEGTYQEVCLQVTSGCVTLPRRFSAIHQYSICNTPGFIDSMGWKYSEQTMGEVGGSCHCGSGLAFKGSDFPTCVPLESPSHLIFLSDRPEDEDAEIRVQGLDEQGREIGIDGSPGAVFSIRHLTDVPYFTGTDGYWSGRYSSISAISKRRTKGVVSIWAYDSSTGNTNWISNLEPNETSPGYTRYSVPGLMDSCQMTAIVKLAYEPMNHKDDVAIIQDIEAYTYMIKSLSAEDSGDLQEAAILKRAAISQLEKQQKELFRGQRWTLRLNLMRAPGRIKDPYKYKDYGYGYGHGYGYSNSRRFI